ncbi:MAG: hypothetical protein HYZ31_04710 [Gammaproteobacteria bacterium]|nr:hypothetical protein [Gammaproteobacteria bacterium]
MIDWQRLKREVHFFLAALVFALLLIGTLLYLNLQTSAQWQQGNKQLQQATMKYRVANDQKIMLALYQQRFTTLNKRHVLGDEQRIDWIETIQASSKRHIIPSVKFSLDQRMPATLPDDINNVAVYVSKMRLDMNLLHEGDLFNLFDDLDNRADGLYGISNCTLKQEARDKSIDALNNSLTGSCELNWFTMGEVVEIQYDENGEPITPEDSMLSDDAGSEDI